MLIYLSNNSTCFLSFSFKMIEPLQNRVAELEKRYVCIGT